MRRKALRIAILRSIFNILITHTKKTCFPRVVLFSFATHHFSFSTLINAMPTKISLFLVFYNIERLCSYRLWMCVCKHTCYCVFRIIIELFHFTTHNFHQCLCLPTFSHIESHTFATLTLYSAFLNKKNVGNYAIIAILEQVFVRQISARVSVLFADPLFEL